LRRYTARLIGLVKAVFGAQFTAAPQNQLACHKSLLNLPLNIFQASLLGFDYCPTKAQVNALNQLGFMPAAWSAEWAWVNP